MASVLGQLVALYWEYWWPHTGSSRDPVLGELGALVVHTGSFGGPILGALVTHTGNSGDPILGVLVAPYWENWEHWWPYTGSTNAFCTGRTGNTGGPVLRVLMAPYWELW